MKKGKLFICGIGVGFIVSVWSLGRGSQLLRASHLGVKTIAVEGCRRTDQQQIAEAVSIPLLAPIFTLDLKKIAQRVESLPWIRSCEVRRVLPNKLSLRIVERRPVALIHLGKLYYVDEDGTPFKEPSGGEPLDYPVLTSSEDHVWKNGEGKELIQEALRLLKEVQNLPHLFQEGISEIHVDEIHALTIFTAKRGTMINLSRGDIPLKLKRVEEVWKRIMARQLPVRYIVCDCPDRIVVGLEERG